MWTRHHRKSKAGALVVPVIAAAFLSYFGFHAWSGEYGINAMYRLEARAAALEADLAVIRGERQAMERRARLLQDGSIERDMLDYHARRSLNMARPDEVIILLGGTSD